MPLYTQRHASAIDATSLTICDVLITWAGVALAERALSAAVALPSLAPNAMGVAVVLAGFLTSGLLRFRVFTVDSAWYWMLFVASLSGVAVLLVLATESWQVAQKKRLYVCLSL